jgi:hypothetical protein
MNLGNLKLGQTKVTDTVAVTKVDSGYELKSRADGHGHLRFNKDAKSWLLVTAGQEIALDGATSKTAVEIALAAWPVDEPELEAAPAPSTELAIIEPAGELAIIEAEIVDAEEITDEVTTLDYPIDTRGGHGHHRAAALGAIAYALGGEVEFTELTERGYRGKAILSILAPVDVIAQIELTLETAETIMERQAAILSKATSSAARAAGKHHSLHGCHARRGFIAGFGVGLAQKLLGDAKVEAELPEIVKLTAHSQTAWDMGREMAISRSI